ncbi:MAG: branched-chain amino acid ABC transporter ATP-binding protein/permease [Chloroflexi bacterium]|nr:branched-chain amino acid ABC transporter ATP-binding protein/permease [Chloroflexota bacterium]
MEYQIDIFNQMLIFAIFALSLNLLIGYGGQVSVAHAALGAAGGYTAAYLSVEYGVPYIPATLFAIGAGTLIGTAVSVPALRLSMDYLILLTLSLSTVLLTLIVSLKYFGGSYGLLGIGGVSVFGKDIVRPSDYLKILLPLLVVLFLACWRLGHSPFGRVLKGIREDEIATRSLGKDVFMYKVGLFAITSAMAGLGGAALVYYSQIASPSQFSFDVATTMIAMIIIGGMGNLWGSLLGVVLVVVSRPVLEKQVNASPEDASLYRLIIYGAALVVVMRLRPEGLIPESASLRAGVAWIRRLAGRLPAPPAPAAGSADATPPHIAAARVARARPGNGLVEDVSQLEAAVQVTGLVKHFGGIRAVDGLDFRLAAGRITGLVGPNGAGKTTVFNLITGAIRPDAGVVTLRGNNITNIPPHRVARRGMVRSFQDVRTLPRLSVLENVALAVPNQPGEHLGNLFFRPGSTARAGREAREKAIEALRFVGMESRLEYPAGALGYGEQKLVALARMLATGADVLLLDEPASGIDQSWLDPILEVILQTRDMGKTICIVEHNLHVVERLADWVYFMEAGIVTAQGTMRDLISQPRLAEVYFGNA